MFGRKSKRIAELEKSLKVVTNEVSRQRSTINRNFLKIEELKSLVRKMKQPPLQGKCNKVRLCNKVEAERFSNIAMRAMGEHFEIYKCTKCPKHPLTGDQYYHITHTDEDKRGRKY